MRSVFVWCASLRFGRCEGCALFFVDVIIISDKSDFVKGFLKNISDFSDIFSSAPKSQNCNTLALSRWIGTAWHTLPRGYTRALIGIGDPSDHPQKQKAPEKNQEKFKKGVDKNRNI